MRPFHFHLITLQFIVRLVCAATLLGGCVERGLSAAPAVPIIDPTGNVFGAKQLRIAPGNTVTIDNDFGGEVQVVAYPTEEVALDYILTGSGNTDNDAAADASSLVTVTLESRPDGARIWARPSNVTGQVPDPQKSPLLHVRVPQRSRVIVQSVRGNVTLSGAVEDGWVHTGSGDITARGSAGPLQLVTDHGAISVDEHADGSAHLDLNASGDITIFAFEAIATVHTTGGNIRFIGTFFQPNNGSIENIDSDFQASGSGNIDIAVPDNLIYRFKTMGGTRVVADFAPAAEPCGQFDSSMREFQLTMGRASGNVGRVEASGTTTSTGYLEGTTVHGIFFFRTNRDPIAIYDPLDHPQRTPSALPDRMIGYCGRFTDADNAKDLRPFFTVQAESGEIWIHQIATQQ